jgi:hypothetical protein
MTGARRGGLAALASATLAAGVLLALPGGSAPAAGPGPIDCTLNPTAPECTTTTSVETTTTFAETTTTFIETTTTFGESPTTEEVVETTTSSSLDVTTSQDVLVPGDGTEGAESTTTTTAVPTTIADDQADDGPLLALIVGGLLLLAVAVGILTWRYWAATRPPLVPAVGSDHG